MTLMVVYCKRPLAPINGTCEETQYVCFQEIKPIPRPVCYRSRSPCLYLNILMSVYVFDSRFQCISSSALILKPFAYETSELFYWTNRFLQRQVYICGNRFLWSCRR